MLSSSDYDSTFGSAWHAGADVKNRMTFVENAGTPSGSLTPDFVGQICRDTTNDDFYIATDTAANTDWALLAQNGAEASPTTGSAASAADELAIPVTAQYVAKTTGADAEALTLANGTPGQVLVIALVTDGGGDGTLTPTTASGFTTIVFADKGDNAALKYVDDTVGWVLLGTAGVAAPPVISLT